MKYLYHEKLATLFYIETHEATDYLAGIPMSADNTFDTEESFIVEDTNEYLDGWSIKAMHAKVYKTLMELL